jgi:hypothetical protein
MVLRTETRQHKQRRNVSACDLAVPYNVCNCLMWKGEKSTFLSFFCQVTSVLATSNVDSAASGEAFRLSIRFMMANLAALERCNCNSSETCRLSGLLKIRMKHASYRIMKANRLQGALQEQICHV